MEVTARLEALYGDLHQRLSDRDKMLVEQLMREADADIATYYAIGLADQAGVLAEADRHVVADLARHGAFGKASPAIAAEYSERLIAV